MSEIYYRPPRHEYKELLRKDATERQEAWDGLTTMQKIACLDTRLGPNVGAKKQRALLKTKLRLRTTVCRWVNGAGSSSLISYVGSISET